MPPPGPVAYSPGPAQQIARTPEQPTQVEGRPQGVTAVAPGVGLLSAAGPSTPTNVVGPPPSGGGPIYQVVSAREAGDAAVAMARAQQASVVNEYDRLVGATLDGRYLIEKKIGEGGMGVVFLARHIVIEKPVAIKVLKREVARDKSVVKRFVQEAKAASRIGHPNIIDVTDFGSTPDGMTYSVMEYVEGGTLSSVLKSEGATTVARTLPIVAQIARALSAAHEKGIVHRDLKPENIFLLNREGRRDFVKIVDFGIAKVAPIDGADGSPRLTRAGTVFGTPEYMAPEQAAGRPDTDQRVDVYALGTIMYEMLVGHVPHKGESLVRTLAMQMLDPIIPPRQARPGLDLSDAFEAVLMKALAKNRDQRYQTMTEFLADLERVSGGIPLAMPSTAGSKLLQAVSAPSESTLVPRGKPLSAELRQQGGDRQQTIAGKRPTGPEARSVDPRARRATGDPMFVAADKSGLPSFDDIMYDEPVSSTSRLPVVIVIMVLFVGGGVAAGLYAKSRGATAAEGSGLTDAGLVGPGSGSGSGSGQLPGRIDAGAIAVGARDAGTGPVPGKHPDAGTVALGRMDAGIPHHPPPPHGDISMRVETRPPGGTLYTEGQYAGSHGMTFKRASGTRLKITCRAPGYRDGTATLLFDGRSTVALCKMVPRNRCPPGELKTPFGCDPGPR